MKILLVEDSATLRHAMTGYIVTAGHEPIIAHSGEAALQLLENTPVDMVIMDVDMPGLNGFETAHLIREWLGGFWIPIIFVTGRTDDESCREGIEAGGDDYLIKPVSPIIITAKIRAMERIIEMRDQLKQLNNELIALSQLDSLTQIYNRRTFNQQAQQHWALARRHEQPLSALMIDIDHFKLYNDHYGHPAGDACLRQLSRAIESCLRRPGDLLGRYGGEEFIVLLPETSAEGAEQVARSINQAIAELRLRHDVSPTSDRVTASIGGATCMRTSGHSLEELIKSADRSLYKVKRGGRNRALIEVVSPHKTLLLADAGGKQSHALCQLLQQHYQLLQCESAQECLELAGELHPHLVVLTRELAEAQNYRLCQQLKTQPGTSTIPLAILGDISEPPDRSWRLDLHLDPSLSDASLVNKINQLLG